MRWRFWASLSFILAVLASAATPTLAGGKGVLTPSGSAAGITSLDGDMRYVAVAAGGGSVALSIETVGGEIGRSKYLHGAFRVPAVAYDGTAGGLSADGRTLVLTDVRHAFGRDPSTFQVLDARTMKVRDEITLEGDWNFDAISPDGRLLYLILYTDLRDPTAYEVRAYDIEQGELLRDPIVDPDEPDEAMTGQPMTRVVSGDGRWAYTLYGSFHRHHPPFIHALDTEGATAQCIDLDALADDEGQLWRMKLEPSSDGAALVVTDRGETLLSVDLETFEVTEPIEDATAASDSGGTPYAAIAAGAAVIATLLLVGRRRWRNGS
jgi:hypothetical protein